MMHAGGYHEYGGDIMMHVGGDHEYRGGCSVPSGEFWQFVQGVDYLILKITYPKLNQSFWLK